MYDESWRLQFARWPFKNRNDWHKTDSYLVGLWFGRERIKRDHCGKNLLQVCSTDESKSESVTVDENSTEDTELESVRKIINTNKEKYAIDETQDE